MKPVKAWTVVQRDEDDRLASYGNGHEAQYPVFPTRQELRAWRARVGRPGLLERIVRVEIRAWEQEGR